MDLAPTTKGRRAVEWTTQSEQQPYGGESTYPGGNGVDPQSTQPLPAAPAGAPAPGNAAVPPVPPAHHAPAPQTTASGYDQCPSCGAMVTSDQRYCLNCGHRRGEPRLPFMDAVTFMDAMKAPKDAQAAPPPKKPRKISPNAALIAGVGTLLLALGIGVLIGRSGSDTAAPAQQAPIVIKGGGGTEEAATASTVGATVGGDKSSTAGKSKKVVKKEKEKAAASGAGAEEVLKPKNGVKLPPAKTGVGDKCEKGTAGCSDSGEFTGNFFGE
jgi:hypothetical protein